MTGCNSPVLVLTDTGVFIKFKNLDYEFDFLKKSVAFFEFFD